MRRFRAAVLFNKTIIGSLIVRLLLLLALQSAGYSFVLMGPPDTGETLPGGIDANYQDEYGGPKNRGRFFRWTIPDFTYAFDASFVNYFGIEGMESVNDAVSVVNDFFVNEAYEGVSRLDLAKHGFRGNHNTYWVNTSAKNAQILDLKSMVLGMLVNHLGLGNPHRHAFTITDVTTNTSSTAMNFQVRLRNYDPQSFETTDNINGVQYSYRLIHDAPIGLGSPLPAINVADMEEFTTDTSGNAWTAVAGITDALYGSTSLFWTDVPTLFSFGGYFDGRNSMGGQYRPRHALTYDDAGGLKYLYKTNNYAYEDLFNNALIGGAPVILENPQFLPSSLAIYFPNQTGRRFPFFPRRAGGNTIAFPYTSSLRGMPIPGFNNANLTATNAGPAGVAMRGGIDKIQFHHQPFDSLLGVQYTPTNFIWTDIFVSPSKSAVGNLKNTTPGASVYLMPSPRDFFFQKVGRQVSQPDILFYADNLGNAADGVPIAWQRNVPDYMDNAPLHLGFATNVLGNEVGPGTLELPALAGSSFFFSFAKFDRNFEVLWSGESSVVGNMEEMPSLWGYIRGPGPNDFVGFPKGSTQDRVWNTVIPDTTVPVISLVSDSGGDQPIEQNTFTRTEETLTIIGTEMASVKAVEVMINDLVIQTIMPVDKYIVSNSRIDIPAGILTDEAEGSLRQIRVHNNVGASAASTQKFAIETGRPVITGTTYDNFVFDRAQTLTVSGYGFKSKTVGETRVDRLRVDDANGGSVEDNGTSFNLPPNGVPFELENIQTLSDTQIVLPIDALTVDADGSHRRLRVARKAPATASDVGSVLSPPTNPLFTAVTTKPVIGTLSQVDGDLSATWENVLTTSMYKRDKILEINGTALNTVSTIEIIQEDGTSFPNPVFIQLPNAGVSMEDNGTRILVAADAIPWADADSNETGKRAFKLYNAVANTDLVAAQTFSVNIQPEIDGLGQFAVAGHFNRDKIVGDDLTIFGSGFHSVSQVILTDANNSGTERVTIELPAPGVTVTDNVISIDTQTFQFGGGADTDVNASLTSNAGNRVIRLTSARDNATSSMDERFHVGAPPSSLTVFGGIGVGNYTRDQESLSLRGNNLGLASKLEIVDLNGNPIPGVPGLITGTDGTSATGGTGLRIFQFHILLLEWIIDIEPNAIGWATTAHLLDSATALSRRVKVTTPFGSTTTSAATGFRVGARPELMSTAAATFAGGGYTADDAADPNDTNGTYDQSEGDLVINGKNFRSTTQITLEAATTVTQTFNVDPANPPAGITFNAEGTQIIIDNNVINMTAWTAGGAPFADDAGVTITTIDGRSVSTIRGVHVQP